jgi:hypothetical protein
MDGVEATGFFQQRQQRSKHISEQLLRLQEESRRLQEQSHMLQERAKEIQRQAGISIDMPEPVPEDPTLAEVTEASLLQEDQLQLERQINEALATGAEAVAASSAAMDPEGAGGNRPAPIMWSLPPGKSGQAPPLKAAAAAAPKLEGKVPLNSKTAAKKSAMHSPGPNDRSVVRNVSILSPASAAALAAAAAGDAGRSGYPLKDQQQERLGSAASTVDNMPVLPTWSGEEIQMYIFVRV